MKIFLIFFLLLAKFAQGEVISIAPLEKGFGIGEQPSMTMYWQGQNSKVLILFIPGGDGYIGIKEDKVDLKNPYYQSLKRLTNPQSTNGQIDVVILDSPNPLSPRQPYPSARGSSGHIVRIESAIRYYKEKTGLPIWLMGQSNGGISLSEFIKYAQKNNKMELISGLILSSARSESSFNATLNIPVLYIHHHADGCSKSSPSSALENSQKMQKINQSVTELVMVTSGAAEEKDACHSGHHMYFGAAEEYSKAIDKFVIGNSTR